MASVAGLRHVLCAQPAPRQVDAPTSNAGRGKGWNITDEDLIALAKTFRVRRRHLRLEHVIDAVNRWPQYGREAGVPIQQIKTIASYRPEWVGLPRKLVAAAKRPSSAKKTARAGATREVDDEDRFKPEARSSANRPGRTTPGNRRGHQQAPSAARDYAVPRRYRL
jgi:hypothetical protein